MSEKRAGGIKQAAIRALEPQLSELVKANRAEARTRTDELEEVLLGLQAALERESTEKVSESVSGWVAGRLPFIFALSLCLCLSLSLPLSLVLASIFNSQLPFLLCVPLICLWYCIVGWQHTHAQQRGEAGSNRLEWMLVLDRALHSKLRAELLCTPECLPWNERAWPEGYIFLVFRCL